MACVAAWAAMTAGASWAQSRYTLTTLSPPSGGLATGGYAYDLTRSFGIDAQGNVVGPAAYANGWYWDSNAPYLRKRYDPHVVRWPASTSAAAVAPVKLLKAPDWTFMSIDVSSSAKKVLVYSKGQAVFDVATQKLGAALPTISNQQDAKVVNDAGAVLWKARSTRNAGVLSPTGVSQPLPSPDASGIEARWLNNQGAVAGVVYAPGEKTGRAAIWAQGQITVVDKRPGVGSTALLMNDAGHVLATSDRYTCNGDYCSTLVENAGVFYQGNYTPILAPGAANPWQVQPQNMNNLGHVVGYVSYDGASGGRGFLWKDGQFFDLTAWLPTQGVTLPAGARIRYVMAINDAGAMVAELVSATNVSTLVRLTPKP